jgi:hypothetical protein
MASGQCVPHQKVEHMAAPTSVAAISKTPCQRRAVHTWRETDIAARRRECPLLTDSVEEV